MKQFIQNSWLHLVIVFMAFFIYSSTIVCAGTYVYDDKEDKKISTPDSKKEKKVIRQSNQKPAGTPYKHKKKDKTKKKPEKLK